MDNEQSTLESFGAFEQPPPQDRDTVSRTLVLQAPVLTAKKSGQLNRAMKEYRRARVAACEYFSENDPFAFTYDDESELTSEIKDRGDINISWHQVVYAIRIVRQNYREFEQDDSASRPKANRADTLALSRSNARIFHKDDRYYLNIFTGHGKVTLPLRTSDDSYHTDRLPHPSSVPPKQSNRQEYAGVRFKHLDPDDFPSRTQRLSTSTLQKKGDRQFTAHLTFQVAKRQERTYDKDEARYIVGVDRGRTQLAYAALYDSETDHVSDWWNRSGDEVEHYMAEFAERMSEFHAAGVWEQLDAARNRRHRYKKQVDYEIANAVIDLAREVNGPVLIALEDLNNMSLLGNSSDEARRFQEWSYFRLGQCIRRKAAPYDIPVITVNPYGTSQQCSRCGESEETDRDGVHFHCEACGYEQHADANAAVNIAKKAKTPQSE